MILDGLQDLDQYVENLDPNGRALFARLLNYIEELSSVNQELRTENQRLRDEIAALKGLKGKPDIKPNRQPDCLDASKSGQNQDSKKEKKKRERTADRLPRSQQIKIDREEIIRLDRRQLPEDVIHRGYREVTIQNIIFQTDTVVYRLEKLYSPTTKKIYEAQLSPGLKGKSYGGELEAFVLMLYYQLRVPEEKIVKLLQIQGIVISAGKISNLISQQYLEEFKSERNAVLEAGLASTSYQHIDDTGMRVNGENCYTFTICNPYYSSFFTTRRKNSETVKQLLNELETSQIDSEVVELNGLASSPQKKKQLGDYIEILVADDAGQFHNQTQHRSLCWIHEGRHYEKLNPVVKSHQKCLDNFLKDFWTYYHKLKAYQQQIPSQQQQQKLQLYEEFEQLFSRDTGYEALDYRISLTKHKKLYLLLVLECPEVPLDNNEAERTLREYVVKRKISNGTRTVQGTQAWEVFLALMDTCRKLGVNFYQYLLDRISKTRDLPALASLIQQKVAPHPT